MLKGHNISLSIEFVLLLKNHSISTLHATLLSPSHNPSTLLVILDNNDGRHMIPGHSLQAD
jgi:hypothetical protein